MTPVSTPIPPTVKVLSHSEIIDRLYGPYLGKKKVAAPQAPVAPPTPVAVAPVPAQPSAVPASAVETRSSASPESAWTGSEILTGELQRLRSELISLRKEKEQLSQRLEKAARPVLIHQAPVEKLGTPQANGIGWIGKLFLFLLVVGTFGYLSGTALQATPSGGDFTPYTVQVAVYNGPAAAGQARGLLKELGYDAFVAPVPWMDGKTRYRVYVGSFVTKEEAARESKRLEADTRFGDFKDAFVLIR